MQQWQSNLTGKNIKKATMATSQHMKDEIVHLLLNIVYFSIICLAAVGLDIFSQRVKIWGVSTFTYEAIYLASHVLLVLDMVLFFTSVLTTVVALVWEVLKLAGNFLKGLFK